MWCVPTPKRIRGKPTADGRGAARPYRRQAISGASCYCERVAALSEVVKVRRIYADTTVIGGCIDPEYAAESMRLVEAVRRGRLVLLLSDVMVAELADAPARVRSVLQSLPAGAVEKVELTGEVFQLRDAYLSARIVGQRWTDDAAHVAAATVAGADAVVSWDSEHLVESGKVKAYNQGNRRRGYGKVSIVTPKEVVGEQETGGV